VKSRAFGDCFHLLPQVWRQRIKEFEFCIFSALFANQNTVGVYLRNNLHGCFFTDKEMWKTTEAFDWTAERWVAWCDTPFGSRSAIFGGRWEGPWKVRPSWWFWATILNLIISMNQACKFSRGSRKNLRSCLAASKPLLARSSIKLRDVRSTLQKSRSTDQAFVNSSFLSKTSSA